MQMPMKGTFYKHLPICCARPLDTWGCKSVIAIPWILQNAVSIRAQTLSTSYATPLGMHLLFIPVQPLVQSL